MVARYGRSGGVNDEVGAVDKLSGEKAQEDMFTFFLDSYNKYTTMVLKLLVRINILCSIPMPHFF